MNKMANYLSFIYKYRSFMDEVCPNIVNKLNDEFPKKKGKKTELFSLDSPTIFFNKKAVAFCGYYVKYKEEYPIYIGLNNNLTEGFWEKNSKQVIEIQKNKEILNEYFIAVDILRTHCKNYKENNTVPEGALVVDWENGYKDSWVYFKIPKDDLKDKTQFTKDVVTIIKNQINYFDN